MAVFASDRRSGWVRVLVLILCALFIFATVATPPAYAVGETVALFGLAAVLSAATAALGFKLANNAEGQATLQKMVQDFTGASIAAGLVLTGSKLNGLVNGMQYIKMAVHDGKTYLDERVAAWCQQWLSDHSVYDTENKYPDYSQGEVVTFNIPNLSDVNAVFSSYDKNYDSNAFNLIINGYNLDLADGHIYNFRITWNGSYVYHVMRSDLDSSNLAPFRYSSSDNCISNSKYVNYAIPATHYVYISGTSKLDYAGASNLGYLYFNPTVKLINGRIDDALYCPSFGTPIFSNSTGLSGTDTLGEDYVNKTLEQILAGLKEWAQDWFDAGADSVTNSQAGAKDLPLSVTTGAATLNPDVADDGPLVWFPAFDWPLGKLRSGETDTKTVDQGKENASAAEISTVDVAENQTVINSLVNWALNYIDPDTGLFSKFPLCVPYDAYLLVTSSLGVDAVGSDSIFGASPGDLDGVVTESIDTYSDFQPIININNDFELDGKTYPISISIDLTPWQPLVTFFREGMALLLIAELIGSEYKRIRGH